jgi:predicted RNA-binding Zn ribbon-like protein
MIPRIEILRMKDRTFRDFRLVGGHPALDLVNTLRYRDKADPGDALHRFEDIIGWSEAAGLLTNEEAASLRDLPTAPEHEEMRSRICSFREDLRWLIIGGSRETACFHAAVHRVEEAIGSLRPTVRYCEASGEITLGFPVKRPEDLHSRIVNAAAELLRSRSHRKIRECAGDDCDWLFIDATKAGRRLWCHTETCGNRSRVRRHRSRTTA